MPSETSRVEDPAISFNFVLVIDGATIGVFTSVGGLGVEMEVETVKEGGLNGFEHKLPGRLKWSNITLKRGITSSTELFDWMLKATPNGLARTTGKISMLNTQYEEVQTWEFEGAFPVKWTGPSLDAGSNEVATEELEIAHHGFRVG